MKTRGGNALFGSIAAALMAFAATAGTELLQNGDFEQSSATDQSWGSYAGKNGYNNPGWTVSEHGGLAKPNGTWMQSGLAVGSFALFIQTGTGSGEVIVRQNVGALPNGVYRIAFSYTSRPKNGSTNYLADPRPVTYVELVEAGGNVISVGSVSTKVSTLSSFAANVFVPAGTYAFRFRQPQTSADRANVFEGVSIKNDVLNIETDYVDFVGTHSSTVLYEEGTAKHNLYLGSGNNIYYPTREGYTVKACRAYFRLSGLTAGEPTSPSANVRAFVLDFGDGEKTGIRSLTPDASPKGEGRSGWYTINGVKLQGKPTMRGIYINNGRKVVIK